MCGPLCERYQQAYALPHHDKIQNREAGDGKGNHEAELVVPFCRVWGQSHRAQAAKQGGSSSVSESNVTKLIFSGPNPSLSFSKDNETGLDLWTTYKK